VSDTTDVRDKLQPALDRVRKSIKLVRDRKDHIGEAQTKTALIDPVLVSLGWDTTDLEEVSLEYRHKPKDNPVDYALFVRRSVCLFVEAKALDTNLDDHKWKSQVVNYANAAGVEWCVLTDGDRYCIYNSHAPVDVEQKLFRSITISDPAQAQFTTDTLGLLSKEKLSDNLLSVLWKAHFVDRNVQMALRGMLEEQDSALIRLIRRRAAELTPSEIKESIRRAHIVIDYPESPLPTGQPEPAAVASAQEEEQAGEAEWGPRSYQGPLQLDGSVVVLRKYRPLLGETVEERVSLDQLRRTAETACSLRDAGQLVSLPAIREHPLGPNSRNPTQRALGAMHLAGAIVFAEGQYTDSFEIANSLTAQGMVQRVIEKAERVSPAQGTQAKRASTGGSQSFKWVLAMQDDGSFSIECRYLPDETKSFRVTGRQVPVGENFKPARKRLLLDIYQRIKPLFPDLPDNRVRAKAWSGVHKVYSASVYG